MGHTTLPIELVSLLTRPGDLGWPHGIHIPKKGHPLLETPVRWKDDYVLTPLIVIVRQAQVVVARLCLLYKIGLLCVG